MQASRTPPRNGGLRLPDLNCLRRTCPNRRMRAAIDFLLAHDLQREFRTEQLSHLLALSDTRVLHLFQQHFKISPAQIIKARRLEQARHLFATSFKGVKEVMAEVGFNDLSHFVRDIKQAYGKTPTQLRQQWEEDTACGQQRPSSRQS